MKPPIFVVGCPRTGTTWVWGLLDKHPETVSLLPQDVLGGRGVETAIFTCEMNLSDEKIREIISTKMEGDSRVLVEKTPLHLWHFERIWEIYPTARLVVLTRSPYGTVNSMLRAEEVTGMKSWPVAGSLARWTDSARIIGEIESDPRVTLVNYENLLEDVVGEYQKLTDSLGLSSAPHIAAESIGVAAHPGPSGLVRRGTADSWKTELKPELIHFITTTLMDGIDTEEAA